MLSQWERNINPVPPKYLEMALDYLGYIPTKFTSFERLGVQTKLYRLQRDISIERLAEVLQIPTEWIIDLETKRSSKLEKELKAELSQKLQELTFCEVNP